MIFQALLFVVVTCSNIENSTTYETGAHSVDTLLALDETAFSISLEASAIHESVESPKSDMHKSDDWTRVSRIIDSSWNGEGFAINALSALSGESRSDEVDSSSPDQTNDDTVDVEDVDTPTLRRGPLSEATASADLSSIPQVASESSLDEEKFHSDKETDLRLVGAVCLVMAVIAARVFRS